MKGSIVVCGATGRQGGAVARSLLRAGWAVRALTRKPGGAGAKALREAGAEIVGGDLDDAASLRRALKGAWGVFGVTEFWEHGFRAEVRQGKALVDAASAAGVGHFLFSSVGGTDRTEGLGIAHFDSKRAVEEHLRASNLRCTIFRPVTFFENFVSPRYRRTICNSGVFRFTIEPSKPFQMLAMADLGAFAAAAFAAPEAYAGKAIELASDAFTMPEFAAALGRAVGRPVRYQCLPPAVQRLVAGYVWATRTGGRYKVGPSLIAQFRWNNESSVGGWCADLGALRAIYPGLLTVDAWAKTVDWRAGLSG